MLPQKWLRPAALVRSPARVASVSSGSVDRKPISQLSWKYYLEGKRAPAGRLLDLHGPVVSASLDEFTQAHPDNHVTCPLQWRIVSLEVRR